MADYNKTDLILSQNELQANGLNNTPNHYMSTGVGGKKTKLRNKTKSKKQTMKKGGNCGCDKNMQTLLHKQGGKKYKKRTTKKSYKNKTTV